MHLLVSRIVLCICALLAFVHATAQTAAPKTIRIIVPFTAGASNDAIARALTGPLAKRLESSIIVENRAGAAGVIGADAVAKSPRDGSVLLLTSSTFLTAAATQSKLPYDPIAAFAPIAMVGQGPLILAVPASAPYKSAADVLNAARAKPGEITYGTAGVGSVAHLATELLDAAAKVQMRHVPYKGAANAAADLAGGHIQVMLSSYSTLTGLISGGKVRALAVTSKQAHPSFPDVPPLVTAVPGYTIEIWVGVFAPAGAPPPLIERYNRDVNEASASRDLAPLLEVDGTVPTPMSASAFAGRVKEELTQWKKIAAEKKIVAE